MSWIQRLLGRGDSDDADRRRGQLQTEMDEVLRNLEREAVQLQVAVSEHLATAEEFRRRAELCQRFAEKRRSEAVLYLQANNEEKAKTALAEAQTWKDQALDAETVWQKAEETTRTLGQQIEAIRLQTMKLQQQRDEWVARANRAELETLLADLHSGIDRRSRAFEAMAEEVHRLEARASAHREVAEWTAGNLPPAEVAGHDEGEANAIFPSPLGDPGLPKPTDVDEHLKELRKLLDDAKDLE